jgi:hypothetical protein
MVFGDIYSGSVSYRNGAGAVSGEHSRGLPAVAALVDDSLSLGRVGADDTGRDVE